MESSGPTPPPSAPRRRLVRAGLLSALLVVWVGVIAIASTNVASEAHSNAWLGWLFRLLGLDSPLPSAGGEPSALSWAVRKTAHLLEYAILGILATYALRALFPSYAEGPVDRRALWKMALVVVPFGLLVAAADEFHQSLEPSRTGLPTDVVIDVVAVTLGVVVVWLIARRRET